MPNAQRKSATERAARVLALTRIFDAPRTLVYAAWTQKEHLMQWSAPAGFSVTASDGELRPGGAWRATMRSPEGEDLHLGGVYREIVPEERLVFTHAWLQDDGTFGPETIVTVRLGDLRGKTKMSFRQTGFDSDASRDGHREGWSETFDRLADHLAAARTTATR